jgi:anti-anti-sigma factor
MDVIAEKRGTALMIAPRGALDSTTAPAFEQGLYGHLDGGESRLVLDLSALEFISSAGLRALLNVAKRCAAVKGRFVVCALPVPLREIFEISGLTTIFEMHPTVDDGLARCR